MTLADFFGILPNVIAFIGFVIVFMIVIPKD